MSITSSEGALKRPRILMLLENCPYPRDDRVRREAHTLAAAGYDVAIIAPRGDDQPWRELLDGVRVYRFPTPSSGHGFWGYAWEYGFSLIATFFISLFVFITRNFDIVHAHQPPDAFAFIAGFYKLFGKRYVLDHHDLAPELYYSRFGGKGRSALYRVLLWLEKFSFGLADYVISTNQSYKDIATCRGRVDGDRVTIVRNGPDLGELRGSDAMESLRESGKTIVGYVGVTGIQDGVDNLMRAIRHLVYDLRRRNLLCVVVGDGSAMPMLKLLANQLQIEPYTVFAGWIREQLEVAKYLNSMDICVAPEPSDDYNDRSTAAKVMEYMAMGKPIVSFDLPEHRFSAQDAAIYAKPGDEMDFARKIAELMDDPIRRDAMSRAGRRRINEELAWHHQEKHLLDAYQKLDGRP